KLKATFKPYDLPRSSKLSMVRDGPGYEFRTNHRHQTLIGFIFAIVGLGCLYWYFGPGISGGEGSPWVVAVVGAVFAAIGIFFVVFARSAISTLRVSPEEIRRSTTLFDWHMSDERLAAGVVEEVTIKKNQQGRACVTVSSDQGVITFGAHLNAQQQEAIRACIIATVAA
ncbi:MAG: hypothetical protein ACR2RB_13125, partial [Gammaproteobacteria bacterium]